MDETHRTEKRGPRRPQPSTKSRYSWSFWRLSCALLKPPIAQEAGRPKSLRGKALGHTASLMHTQPTNVRVSVSADVFKGVAECVAQCIVRYIPFSRWPSVLYSDFWHAVLARARLPWTLQSIGQHQAAADRPSQQGMVSNSLERCEGQYHCTDYCYILASWGSSDN